MTVLFATTILPRGRVTGSEVASCAFIAALREAGHRVVVLGYRRRGSELELGADELNAGDRPIETGSAGARALAWLLGAFVRRLPYSLAKYRSVRYLRLLRTELARAGPQVLIVDHAQVGWLLRRANVEIPSVYLAHNVEHRLHRDAAATSRWPRSWIHGREARLIETVERALVERASATWALSADDAAALQALAPASRPLTISLPPTIPGVEGAEPKRHDVGLLGTWTWGPNAAGLRWFLEQVMPRLPQGLEVAVAGSGAREMLAAHPGVAASGLVADASAFLRASRVIAVPSTAGAGVQIKTLDAIGTGEPVVATSVALRGIVDPPRTVRVVDRAEDFAEALVSAARNAPDLEARTDALQWTEKRQARFRSSVRDALELVAPPGAPAGREAGR